MLLSRTTESNQLVQITPTIPAVKLSAGTVEPPGLKHFVKSIRRIRCLTEEEHRSDTSLEEAAGHMTQKESTDALAVKAAQDVNLVELTRKARHPAVMWRPLCKADQLAPIILDDEAKPTPVIDCKRLAPLMLPKLEGRPAAASAPMCFVEGLDVQTCQRGNVAFSCLSDVE